MAVNLAHLGLAIEIPWVTPESRNYRPKSWPPHRDFPIINDSLGVVVSRYGDSIWDISLWANKRQVLNFGDGTRVKGRSNISKENADLLRQVTAWWLYGPKAVWKAQTLKNRFNSVRAIFILCSDNGIVASDLKRFPAVADRLPEVIIRSQYENVLTLLHALYEQRELLGFTILDRAGLARLAAAMPAYESRQTPYIPPRIWTYQINRLRACLVEFQEKRDAIEACYRFCLSAYEKNFGSLPEAFRSESRTGRLPFGDKPEYTGEYSGSEFHGSFIETARKFGIDSLLMRWVAQVDDLSEGPIRDIKCFSTYLSMVSHVGMAYLLNFSLMRRDEAWALRSDCLEIENDTRFGLIYILRGGTTKTVEDDDARWPTSPSVRIAVDVLSCIARLRMICAQANPAVKVTEDEVGNPHLIQRAYEPWSGGSRLKSKDFIRSVAMSYGEVVKIYSGLFDAEELRITDGDLQVARLVTPTLDAKAYSEGIIWPLAWHQLRRTGAVNMQASGLVSDSSLQYLLKHATRSMSLYYGHGFSRVGLNEEARNLYIRTMYEVLGREVASLFSDRYVSPHGEKRKSEILNLVDPKDSNKLTELAKAGKISWRVRIPVFLTI